VADRISTVQSDLDKLLTYLGYIVKK